MPSCEVHQCSYTTGKSDEYYRMHSFPDPVKKPLQFAQWCSFAKGKNSHRLSTTNRAAIICAKHFLPSDYLDVDIMKLRLMSETDPSLKIGKPRLRFKSGVVPTQYPPDPSYSSPVQCDCKKVVKMEKKRLKKLMRQNKKSEEKNENDKSDEELNEKQKLKRLDDLINDAEQELAKPIKIICNNEKPKLNNNKVPQFGGPQWVMVQTERKKCSQNFARLDSSLADVSEFNTTLPTLEVDTVCASSEPNMSPSDFASENNIIKSCSYTKSVYAKSFKVEADMSDATECLPNDTCSVLHTEADSESQFLAEHCSETSQTSCSKLSAEGKENNDAKISESFESNSNQENCTDFIFTDEIVKSENEYSELFDDNCLVESESILSTCTLAQSVASAEQFSHDTASHQSYLVNSTKESLNEVSGSTLQSTITADNTKYEPLSMSLQIPLSEVFKLLSQTTVEHETCQFCDSTSVHVKVVNQQHPCVLVCPLSHVTPCSKH